MGTPEENPEGYEVSSIMYHIDKLKGHLLLIHGLIDENVHFRHSARLINALIRANKPYELILFPDERHLHGRAYLRVYSQISLTLHCFLFLLYEIFIFRPFVFRTLIYCYF